MKKISLMIAGVMIGAAFMFCPCKADAAVKNNEPAPNFTLPSAAGGQVSLEDYQGKYVVLEWVNYQCPFVVKHYGSGNMQSLQDKYTSEDVVWLSINSSAEGKQGYFSADELPATIKAQGAKPTAYLMDTDGTVGRTYGAKTTPHIFIVNPEGNVIYQGAIDSDPSFDPSSIEGADNFVRIVLDQAIAGLPVSVSSTKSYGCSVKY